ncbi:MAG TPA: dTDP-4-dehydrorhamnose 3,5-epimerase [Anaerolineae bacterium]|nr:dTDP-4-dehydrorhamnose 3,5-epimerase [Anaerolineae bacterium]
MKIIPTNLPDVLILQPQVFQDDRGFFMETYHQRKLEALGISAAFVQDNHSASQQGSLRGLHYQIQQTQGKLVRVIAGEVFDVAVDLRRRSPTFGQWTGLRLSAGNKLMLWVPPGFAHGFYTLSLRAEFLYKVTDYYAPDWDRTLLWNDPQLGIDWPLIDGQPPLLSPKDAIGRRLTNAEVFDW